MSSNLNLVRASEKLKATKAEVEARTGRSTDDEGQLKSDIFRIKNPDIEASMGEWLTERSQEIERLQTEIDDYLKSDGALDHIKHIDDLGKKVDRPPLNGKNKASIPDSIFQDERWGELKAGRIKGFAVDTEVSLKELFATDSASATDRYSIDSVREDLYVPSPRTRPTILDIIPQLPTTERVVKYAEETVNLSNVFPISQGDPYLESQFQVVEKSASVVKRGAYIQVSEELLMDEAEIRARLAGALTAQFLRRVQNDIIGSSPLPASEYVGAPTDASDIEGFLDVTGVPELDGNAGQDPGSHIALYTLIAQARERVWRSGEADADAIVMTSQDWAEYQTEQSTIGSYIARGALQGTANAPMMMIDDLPVILCNALPEHRVLVGAFGEHCALRDRQQVQVRISEAQHVPSVAVTSMSTATVNTVPSGRFNIYVDGRYTFYIRRPSAFVEILNFGVAAA